VLSTPDKASAICPDTVTGTIELVGGEVDGLAVAVTLGRTLSMLTTGEVDVRLLPATSTAVTVTDWFAPLVLNTAGLTGLTDATPEVASVTV